MKSEIKVSNLKVELLVLCDHALTSREGKLSIIGIFDRIFVKNIPAKFSRFFVVAVLKGEPNQRYDISLSVKNPQGEEVLPQTKKISIKLGSHGHSNIITDVVNMPLSQAGTYSIALSQAKQKISTKKLNVVKLKSGDDNPFQKLTN